MAAVQYQMDLLLPEAGASRALVQRRQRQSLGALIQQHLRCQHRLSLCVSSMQRACSEHHPTGSCFLPLACPTLIRDTRWPSGAATSPAATRVLVVADLAAAAAATARRSLVEVAPASSSSKSWIWQIMADSAYTAHGLLLLPAYTAQHVASTGSASALLCRHEAIGMCFPQPGPVCHHSRVAISLQRLFL